MVDLTIQGIRKNTQVSDAECFKQKTKGFEIIHKVIRSDAQCRGSNRWVNIISGVRRTDGSPEAKIRIPRRHILYNEDLAESADICSYCFIAHRDFIVCGYILRKHCIRYLTALISGVGTH